MAVKGENPEAAASQTIVPSCPSAPKFNVEPAATVTPGDFSVSVVPCSAAMVELPDNERAFVRDSLAVASSSPPLWVTVPVPRAPALPNARTPLIRETLPIAFALLSDTKPESTVSAPPIVNETEISWSSA
jgi:hypothetical protein